MTSPGRRPLCLLVLAASCAAPPSDGAVREGSGGVPTRSERQEAMGEAWETSFANGTRAVAGRFLDKKKVGVWRYWHPSGALLLIGRFSEEGWPEGPWLLFEPDGSPDHVSGLELVCEDWGASMRSPGFEHWQSAMFDPDVLPDILSAVPGSLSAWVGSGFYADGRRVRGLAPDEWSTALRELRDQL